MMLPPGSRKRAVISGRSAPIGWTIEPPWASTALQVASTLSTHDVEEHTGRAGLAAGHERAAHLTRGVIERGAAIAPLAHRPAEHLGVEGGRPRDVHGRQLEIADLSVGECGSHGSLSATGFASEAR